MFTRSSVTFVRAAAELEAAAIGINHTQASTPEAPFGVKDSGFGRENGLKGLDAYFVTKAIHEAAA